MSGEAKKNSYKLEVGDPVIKRSDHKKPFEEFIIKFNVTNS